MEKHCLTITIPSTGRPGRLRDCIASIPQGDDIQIKVGCRSFNDDIPKEILNDTRVSITAFHNDIVPIQNALARTAPIHSDVLPVADDIIFQPGAIENARKHLYQRFSGGDGIVGFKIVNMSEKNASPYAFMLVGAKFFNDRIGRTLFCEGYKHFFADTELGQYAQSLERFEVCQEAAVIHLHPNTGAPADATYLNRRSEKLEADSALFLSRN
jgi:hypothetical protein